jgi:hypothetical protein
MDRVLAQKQGLYPTKEITVLPVKQGEHQSTFKYIIGMIILSSCAIIASNME